MCNLCNERIIIYVINIINICAVAAIEADEGGLEEMVLDQHNGSTLGNNLLDFSRQQQQIRG